MWDSSYCDHCEETTDKFTFHLERQYVILLVSSYLTFRLYDLCIEIIHNCYHKRQIDKLENVKMHKGPTLAHFYIFDSNRFDSFIQIGRLPT